MTLLAAIDQGTTSTRFVVATTGGKVIAQAQFEHRQILPREGWVEHDPLEIWRNTRRAMSDAVAVSYTHLTLPTIAAECRSRWSPYH